MRYEEFLLLFHQHFYTAIILWLLSVIFGIILFRKYIYSIIDPLFFHIVTSYSGFTIIFFLYFLGFIEDYYFYSFLLTQIALTIGFFSFKPVKRLAYEKQHLSFHIKISTRFKFLFLISVILYIISKLTTWYLVGIPLFKRMAGFSAYQGGLGVFARIESVVSPIILSYLSFKTLYQKRLNFWEGLILLFVLISTSVSGSKAALLSLLFTIFYVYMFSWRFRISLTINKKLINSLIILSVLVSVGITTYFYNTSSFFEGLYLLLMRVIFTGDIYMMAYPNNVISQIHIEHGNLFYGLFGWFFAGIKLIPWDKVPDLVGHAIAKYVYNSNLDFAPNSRHNIFCLYYLGFWGSISFSFLLGILMSFIRNVLYYKVRANLEGMIIYILFVKSCFDIESDPPYAVFGYTSLLLVFVPIYVLSYIFAEVLEKSKIYKN